MPSTVIGTTTTGAHFVVSVLHPSGATHKPRFLNSSPDARTLTQYQTDCQAAATTVVDATVGRGPNATTAILNLR